MKMRDANELYENGLYENGLYENGLYGEVPHR
jgi:hypothetical protein